MSRKSWIVRPPGSRYLALFADDVERFGLGAAAVISLLDFFDRANDVTGLPTASRERIIAELQGIVGKHSVDTALQVLLELGVVARHQNTEMGRNNIKRTVRYGINTQMASRIISGTPKTGSIGDSQNRELQEFPIPEPKPGDRNNEVKKNKEAAAPRADARGTVGAATAAPEQSQYVKRQHPDRSRLGIECWYATEDHEADAIIAAHTPDAITAAVSAIKSRLNGVGRKTSPVPALVREEIERQQLARKAGERNAQQEAAMREQAIHALDPTAQAKGELLLPPGLRALVHKSPTQQETAP